MNIQNLEELKSMFSEKDDPVFHYIKEGISGGDVYGCRIVERAKAKPKEARTVIQVLVVDPKGSDAHAIETFNYNKLKKQMERELV